MSNDEDNRQARQAGYWGTGWNGVGDHSEYNHGQASRAAHDAMQQSIYNTAKVEPYRWDQSTGSAGGSAYSGYTGYSGPAISREGTIKLGGAILVGIVLGQLVAVLTAAVVIALCALPWLYLIARFDKTHRWRLRALVKPAIAAFLTFVVIQSSVILVLRAYPHLLGDSRVSGALARVAITVGDFAWITPLWWMPVARAARAYTVPEIGTIATVFGVIALHIPALLGAALMLKARLQKVAKVSFRSATIGLMGSAAGGAVLAGIGLLVTSKLIPEFSLRPAPRATARASATPARAAAADPRTEEFRELDSKRAAARATLPTIVHGTWVGNFGPGTPTATLIIRESDAGVEAVLTSPTHEVTFRVEALNDWRDVKIVDSSDATALTGTVLLTPVSAATVDGLPALPWLTEFKEYWRGAATAEFVQYPHASFLRGHSPMRKSRERLWMYMIGMQKSVVRSDSLLK